MFIECSPAANVRGPRELFKNLEYLGISTRHLPYSARA